MAKNRPSDAGEILQGTLDMLILRTLILGPAHGHTIARSIEHTRKTLLTWSRGRSIRLFTGLRIAAWCPQSGA